MIIISCFKRCLTLSDCFWLGLMVVFWTAPVNTLNCKRVLAYKSLTSLGSLFAGRYFIILFSCHLFWSHANKHTTSIVSSPVSMYRPIVECSNHKNACWFAVCFYSLAHKYTFIMLKCCQLQGVSPPDQGEGVVAKPQPHIGSCSRAFRGVSNYLPGFNLKYSPG